MVSFGEEFFFGAATASYQVEGGIENNDWAKASREGRVPKAGAATNHYRRFLGDFSIAKALGHNAHRFSIEWARIEPIEGRFDEREVEHYRQVIAGLRVLGLEPFVTIWHFTLPTWFSESGGWHRKDAVAVFSRYVSFIVSRLGRNVTYWTTMNEPLVYASGGYLRGKWPPFRKNFFSFLRTVRVLQDAHMKAYQRIKNFHPYAEVGIAKHNIDFVGDGKVWTGIAASCMRWFWNRTFLNATKEYHDYIGVNYYFHKQFGEKKSTHPMSDMGWEIYPHGLYRVLREVGRYKKPVYVLENGLADAEDRQRGTFIRDHVREIMQAKNDGVDVRGYFHWALLDNFEWAEGFGPRFGLVAVDYATMNRTVRQSALLYKQLIEQFMEKEHEKPKFQFRRFAFRRVLW